jgi:PAS domain S-box-containing protein
MCGLSYFSIFELKKGNITAKYFLLGTLLFLFFLIVQILSDVGFISDLFKNALVVGSAIKLLVISFGLEEINIIQNDELSIKAEDLNDANHKLKLLYRKIEKANSRLENKVKARTNELFSSLNETKDILNNMRQAVFSADENYLIIYPVSKYSEEIFGENIVGKNVLEEVFSREFLEKLGFVLSISMNMDIFQFESMEDTIPKKTTIDLKDGSKKSIKVQLSPICDEEDIVKRVMFIVEDITEEEKLKEEVRRTQEKAEYRIQILQEIVSNSRSEFRVFIKEVFETLDEWGDDEGAKRSIHTI